MTFTKEESLILERIGAAPIRWVQFYQRTFLQAQRVAKVNLRCLVR